MKQKIKITAILIITVMWMFIPVQSLYAGPFTDYGNCVNVCVDTTSQWSWARTACAADCYVQLLADLATLPARTLADAL